MGHYGIIKTYFIVYYLIVLAQLMKNTGCLVVNDANKERIKAVFGNLHRMGIVNTCITNVDGRKMPKVS